MKTPDNSQKPLAEIFLQGCVFNLVLQINELFQKKTYEIFYVKARRMIEINLFQNGTAYVIEVFIR